MNPVIDGILSIEGGYSNSPADRGGETNWGITKATARANGYQGEMKALTREEAYAILENVYWVKPGFEGISQLSWPISFELCDAAVNVGPKYPCIWLQRWLNVFNKEQHLYPDLSTDGLIGSRTLAALERFLTTRGGEGEEVLLRALNCSQGAYYLTITEERQQNEQFIYGWLKNRVV